MPAICRIIAYNLEKDRSRVPSGSLRCGLDGGIIFIVVENHAFFFASSISLLVKNLIRNKIHSTQCEMSGKCVNDCYFSRWRAHEEIINKVCEHHLFFCIQTSSIYHCDEATRHDIKYIWIFLMNKKLLFFFSLLNLSWSSFFMFFWLITNLSVMDAFFH